MKKFLLLIFLGFIIFSAYADNGWRENEKEIKVYIKNQSDAKILHQLLLNGDFYYDHAILYVIPSELKRVESTGLKFEILKEDLNKYYANFWENKDAYHTYQEIIDLMDSLVTAFPGICSKTVYGTSIEGRELSALKISDNVSIDEPEAEVMFDGGIHGDEIGTAENCIRFARHLCVEYGNNPQITTLINTREIWIYCMVNPDGRVNMSRYNANGVDLNRDWGYMWDGWGSSTGAYSQVESKALRKCMYNNQFVVHTTYHSGTEYISCPWSYRPDHCPDYDHIIQLAGVYSFTSGYPNLQYGQGCTGMYPINGSSKDSNYGVNGSISWSMEISYSKQPPASQIMLYYNYNEPSMIAMIEYSGYGLEGTVTDANTGDPIAAIIKVNDYFPTYSDSTAGDYHKYVLPGTYSISVLANNYQTQTINNIVVNDLSSTVTDFQLQPDTSQYVYKFSSSRIPNNNHADEGNTSAVFGAPDDVFYSIGKNGWVVLDMQYPISDGPGNDFIVYEGDDTPEGYDCYVALSMDGPWVFLGEGNGTTEFNIANAFINNIQFIKIDDDGDGTANVNDAGFDLDAIEVIDNTSGMYLLLSNYIVDDEGGNGNGKIDPGETVDIIVTLVNNGDYIAQNVTGVIDADTTYITIDDSTTNFGTIAIGDTATGTFTITAKDTVPAGQNLDINLNVSSNSGTYTNSYVMNFIIGQIPILVLDLDGNTNSGPIIQTALEDAEVISEYLTEFPEDLSVYTSVFACLGTYNSNYVLTVEEGQLLANFLNTGGSIYMEGGDTWSFDNQTAVHTMFNINGVDDGNNDLGTILGIYGTFTEDMNFSYSGDNSYIDHLEPIGPAVLIFENQSPSYKCAIAHDAVDFKTIGSSFEFGGLDDGTNPSTKEEYMTRILNFFNGIYTGVEKNNIVFLNDELGPNYPNPFNNLTTINYTLNNSSNIQIDIFDITGKNIKSLVDEFKKAGKHKVTWDARDNYGNRVPCGIYFYILKTCSSVQTKKMILSD